jgi:alpha-glucosidase
VDGFRIDAACLILKDEQFRDNPPNPDYRPGDGPDSRLKPVHTRNQPGLHEILASIRALTERYDDRVLLGEIYLALDALATFYGQENPELHLPLNLFLTYCDWEPEGIGRHLEAYHDLVPPGAWPTAITCTHDAFRMAARADGEQTRIAAMLLLTLRGTPTVYYGEEIGMRGVPIPADKARDPQGRRTGRNRDPVRTPMQWSAEEHAGFAATKPWLPIGNDYRAANVADQSRDPRSLLSLYRRLIALRSEQPALLHGSHEPVALHAPLLAYRRCGAATLLIALNFGHEAQTFELDAPRGGRILLSTFLDRAGAGCHGRVDLRGDEGLVIALY